MNGCARVAIAFHRRIDAIPVDSALAGVDSIRVVSGPKILRIAVPVVPPGVRNVIEFKRGVVTIVLD